MTQYSLSSNGKYSYVEEKSNNKSDIRVSLVNQNDKIGYVRDKDIWYIMKDIPVGVSPLVFFNDIEHNLSFIEKVKKENNAFTCEYTIDKSNPLMIDGFLRKNISSAFISFELDELGRLISISQIVDFLPEQENAIERQEHKLEIYSLDSTEQEIMNNIYNEISSYNLEQKVLCKYSGTLD